MWVYSDVFTEYDCLLVYSAVCYDKCPQEPLALIVMADSKITFPHLNPKQNTMSHSPSLDAKFSSVIVAQFIRIPDVKIWPYASHKGMAPLILNHRTECEVLHFIPQSLSPREYTALPLGRMLLGLRIFLDGFGEEKFPCLFGIQTLYHPAPSLSAVPTALFLLLSPIYANILLGPRVVAERYLLHGVESFLSI